MKRFYYLSSCSTFIRILKEINLSSDFELMDIKRTNIDADTLDIIASKTGLYESLFSRKAMKYKALGLNKQNLSEQDFRQLILEEYTFLKRPVLIDGNHVFVGNSKDTVNQIIKHLNVVY